jgi:hypothetical protein
MVFDHSPDEIFREVVQRGLDTFKSAIEGAKGAIGDISAVIRTGDETLRDLDDALTGGRPKFGEPPQETFTNILEMLHGTLADAREKQSAAAASVVQKSREILNRINLVEPAWRPGPMSMTTMNDVFRGAMRDLRASNSLIRLAQGQGTLDDLKGLSDWADDLKGRLNQVTDKTEAVIAPAASESTSAESEKPNATRRAAPSKPRAKKAKKDTTPKSKADPQAVTFALAVAEEYGDNKVKEWAQEFADGKISEAQWQSRLTNHAAAVRDNLDDVFERALARVAKERDANQG